MLSSPLHVLRLKTWVPFVGQFLAICPIPLHEKHFRISILVKQLSPQSPVLWSVPPQFIQQVVAVVVVVVELGVSCSMFRDSFGVSLLNAVEV